MVPFIIDHSFVKFFQIRDYSPIEDLLRFQYESETAEAKLISPFHSKPILIYTFFQALSRSIDKLL